MVFKKVGRTLSKGARVVGKAATSKQALSIYKSAGQIGLGMAQAKMGMMTGGALGGHLGGGGLDSPRGRSVEVQQVRMVCTILPPGQ